MNPWAEVVGTAFRGWSRPLQLLLLIVQLLSLFAIGLIVVGQDGHIDFQSIDGRALFTAQAGVSVTAQPGQSLRTGSEGFGPVRMGFDLARVLERVVQNCPS